MYSLSSRVLRALHLMSTCGVTNGTLVTLVMLVTLVALGRVAAKQRSGALWQVV